ncbi:hypothetical protein [Ascidiimonas aurantiaca]|uniref:hypothetical protein n=1 Tax=Ascidiimonas aurantiaca TaxID=1685432 RepID=UPI0030EBFC24
MKRLIRNLFTWSLAVVLVTTSCQDEVDVIGPDTSSGENIEASSATAQLISRTSAKDGSTDNIVDGASCISVVFPISVTANGLEITLDSEDDLEVLEAIFDEFDDDDDVLDILFPITIVTGDFTEVTINNEDELETYVERCIEGGDDDDIECIDFNYPLTFFTFNANLQQTDTIVIESDRQLYRFFDELDDDDIVSLQYPVSLTLYDNTVITVNSNEELRRALESASDACDEDDDDDYNDDDFTKERLDNLLAECPWEVDEVRRNSIDQTEQYLDWFLIFAEDGSVTARSNVGASINGTWNTQESDNGILLTLDFDLLSDFTLEWLVYEIDDDEIKLYSGDGDRIRLEQDCDFTDSISEDRVANILEDCLWIVKRLQLDGVDNSSAYLGTPIKFEDGGQAKLRVNGTFVTGTWNIVETSAGFAVEISFQGRPELNLSWLITSLEEYRVTFVNENSELVLEKYCEGNNDGEAQEVRSFIINSTWLVASYFSDGVDGTANFSGYEFGFDTEGKVVVEGNGQMVEGSWVVYLDNDSIDFDMNLGENDPFNNLNEDWEVVSATETRIELKQTNDNMVTKTIVFEKAN